MNERIVSTCIYYWDSENVTDSRLSFRVAVGEPEYEQNDRKGVREVYGVGGEDAMNQVLGSAETRVGRALAFPNILQHRVDPPIWLITPPLMPTSHSDKLPASPGRRHNHKVAVGPGISAAHLRHHSGAAIRRRQGSADGRHPEA